MRAKLKKKQIRHIQEICDQRTALKARINELRLDYLAKKFKVSVSTIQKVMYETGSYSKDKDRTSGPSRTLRKKKLKKLRKLIKRKRELQAEYKSLPAREDLCEKYDRTLLTISAIANRTGAYRED